MKAKTILGNLIIIALLTLVTTGSFGAYLLLTIEEPEVEFGYAASDQNNVPVYTLDEGVLSEASSYVRGQRIKCYSERVEIDGAEYIRLIDEDNAYYMSAENMTASKDDIVREKEVYVRTPSTIYANEIGADIASFAEKGRRLDITGYDKVLPDGSVNKYKVAYGEDKEGHILEGFVYNRYLVRSQEEADAVYTKVYDKVKKDNYGMNLHGGKAAHLDYYPRERIALENNEFCADARAMYINGAAAVKPKNYVKIIKETDCNAVVIDIKDGYLAYKSELAKEMSPRSYKSAYSSVEDYKKGVDAYRETGAYLIGRIVVFNDPIYAKDHPEDCIKYAGDSGWPSAFSRNVWEYNVKLALEAVELFGFNEIQFDYVRFPETSYEMSQSGKANFRNTYKEEKGQAVQNFCIYAADMLHEAGAYMSVDVFGESAYGYMTAYGQYWAGIANVADAISAMPYTDHMGGDGTWEKPYNTMLAWSKRAKKQHDKLEAPAAARTWITGYNTPHWNPTVDYGAKELKAQVKALEKAGLTGGFIPWNAASSIGKYRQYKAVWKKQ